MITYATNFTMQRLTGLCRQGSVRLEPDKVCSTNSNRTRTIAPGLSTAQVSKEVFKAPAQTIKIHSYSPSRWNEPFLRNKIERSRRATLVTSSGHNR